MRPILIVTLLLLIGCEAEEPDGAETSTHSTASFAVEGGKGMTFDPAQVAVGESVGSLRLVDLDAEWSEERDGWIGSAAFEGEITLSGTYRPHPVQEIELPCFDVDDETAGRLPRFPGDARQVWLCFDNADMAERTLGKVGTQRSATVVVNDYRTTVEPTDTWDTATLIREVSRSDAPQ